MFTQGNVLFNFHPWGGNAGWNVRLKSDGSDLSRLLRHLWFCSRPLLSVLHHDGMMGCNNDDGKKPQQKDRTEEGFRFSSRIHGGPARRCSRVPYILLYAFFCSVLNWRIGFEELRVCGVVINSHLCHLLVFSLLYPVNNK